MILIPMLYSSYSSRQLASVLLFEILAAAIVCGMSDMLGGYDRYIYSNIFDSTSKELKLGYSWLDTSAILNNPTEEGWGVYNLILASFIHNRYIFILVHTLIVYALFAWHMKKLSPYPLASFFVLFCMLYFFTWTYLRQTMACAIVWFAIPYAVKRKPIPFILIVLLGASFHNSALLFLFTYFVSNIEFSRNTLIILFILSIIIGLTPIGALVFNAIGSQINEAKASGTMSGIGQTPRLDYIAEALVFLSIFYLRYEHIEKEGLSLCLLNIGLLFVFVLTFFARFSDGGRMSWFFMVGIACTVGQVIDKTPYYDWVKYMTVVVFGFLFFRIVFSWGILVRPYKTFLSNGVREGDYIWEQYEYDHQYDYDKLYNLHER